MWPITLSGRLCIGFVSRYHQLANAPRVHPSATRKRTFKSKPCGFDCYTVLAPASKALILLMGRLPTCYSRSPPSFPVEVGGKEAFDLHVLGIASVRPEPGQLFHKVRTILRLLSSICLLAYCLLVKNVCCLELNQDALHIWFVLLCSVFKGLLHRECFPIRFWLP